mmetsp:Transcript_93043/g.221228  ORF Transcript_93043/g.221228 Transcript_93043/m.221228 type:complete len:224 (-) Transcript_93043:412-1083(-)
MQLASNTAPPSRWMRRLSQRSTTHTLRTAPSRFLRRRIPPTRRRPEHPHIPPIRWLLPRTPAIHHQRPPFQPTRPTRIAASSATRISAPWTIRAAARGPAAPPRHPTSPRPTANACRILHAATPLRFSRHAVCAKTATRRPASLTANTCNARPPPPSGSPTRSFAPAAASPLPARHLRRTSRQHLCHLSHRPTRPHLRQALLRRPPTRLRLPMRLRPTRRPPR